MIYNQFLLTELIRAQARVEKEQKDLGAIKDDLQKQGINIDDLVISGNASLQDIFHLTTVYNKIERAAIENINYKSLHVNRRKGRPEYIDLTLEIFQVAVDGLRRNDLFKATIGHKDIIFPFNYDKTRYAVEKLEKVQAYLQQRQADQQPKYNHTYRSNTEIK